LDEERQTDTDDEPDHNSQCDVQRLVGADWLHARLGGVHDFRHDGLRQGYVNLLVSDFQEQDLPDALSFLQLALCLEVRVAPCSRHNVICGSSPDFILEALEARPESCYFGFIALHDAIDSALNLCMQILDAGLALHDFRMFGPVLLFQSYQLLLGEDQLFE